MPDPLLEQLNEAQYQAVTHQTGPCSVIAGAGSGKTRVLTRRIAYLIQQGIDPSSIMALTFTNKAAQEMKKRISELLQRDVHDLWIGTFHSLFRRILRQHAQLLGYTSYFSIYDTDDSLALIKQLLKESNLNEEKYKPRAVLNTISRAKQDLIPWRSFLQSETSTTFRIGPLYKSYTKHCHKANAMDFDDLLFNTHLLLSSHPELLSNYQSQFQHMLIDEFQDTNRSQYLNAQLLAQPENNICVVGDDSQSIYSFRGAKIENILDFQRDYPQARLIRLEQNYRSTSTIIQAADSLISKNTQQIPKKLWSANSSGSLIHLIHGRSDNEEARLVSSTIFEQRHSFGYSLNDMAILYRTHNQSRSLEEALRRTQIPYRIYGSLSFFQRKEVKDLLSYLRFTLNSRDDLSLQRIINLPKRGIGDVTMQRLRLCAMDHDISLWEAICGAEQLLEASTAQLLIKFREVISPLITDQAETLPAYELAIHISKATGLLQMYQADTSPEGTARTENLQELLNSIRSFSEETDREDCSLGAFLQEIALITEIGPQSQAIDAVQMMTIHMAKGLEFKLVFIVGLEEDLFPSYQSKSHQPNLEEERRLFYVAMTRAKEKLFLSYAQQRYQYGSLKHADPSRFLSEIDTEYIDPHSRHSLSYTRPSPSPRPYAQKPTPLPTNKKLKPLVALKDPLADAPDRFKVGMKVEHRLFGSGKILDLSHESSPRARILFSTHGEKTLVLQFARLKIL